MISAFEYITVFISIILGLGVTQILTGVADLVQQHKRVKLYGPHLLWILLVLVMHVQEWWIVFQLRDMSAWRLPLFLFVMLYPVVLFILARLLFPLGAPDGPVDLRQFYYENYRQIFLFGAILAALTLLDNALVRHAPGEDYIAPAVVFVLLGATAARRHTPPWIHQAIAYFMLISLAAILLIEQDQWLVAN